MALTLISIICRQIQVDAGTGFGESLMGERPVEFLVQQSNDGVASTRNSHDSIRWLLSTQ
uniref:Uncharacterized protein n=1 Tax=Oryza rufipogon TaxID=4529 RepID=A0A0E0QAM9_ORYRU